MGPVSRIASHRRILFVDDEPGIRATLPAILRKYGFDVRVAATVPEAAQEIATHPFDLLLCDLNLGREADGYQVVHAIREVNPRCATIILTGYPGLESAIEGIHQGVDDYLIKPTNADQLVALLAKKLADRAPKARILSVSSDAPLLRTRHMLLERDGYEVVSTLGTEEAVEKCRQNGFDLMILGHSIDRIEKQKIVEAFRTQCDGTIVSLRRSIGEERLPGAHFHIDPDPEALLKTVAQIVQQKLAQA